MVILRYWDIENVNSNVELKKIYTNKQTDLLGWKLSHVAFYC